MSDTNPPGDPLSPGTPGDPGRSTGLPRPIGALRGNIARIARANRDRHDAADAEREATLLRMEIERRRRSLVAALARVSFFEPGDLLTLAARYPSGDFTVGELYEHLVSNHRLVCTACNYSLRGLKPAGACPECGAPYRTGLIAWEDLGALMAAELNVPAPQVTADTWVLRRLDAVAHETREEARQ